MVSNANTSPSWLQEPPSLTFRWVAGISLMLLAYAYISHLGVLPVDPRIDEARRALVTLEMMHRHDYIVPTINGEAYLNKPPLYNWLLVGFYKVLGVTAFALRLPVILFTFFYGWLIWHFVKKYTSDRIAVVTALFFVTNGRILIYDSIQGLIDVGFSSLVFLCFMWVYHYGKKQQYLKMFLLTYFIVGITFLMKGIPALAFQAFSLMGFFLLERKFKVLFSPAHFAGIGLFLLVTGAYYIVYFQRANITLAEMFGNMLTENTKRTVLESDHSLALRHFITYPFTLVYHFAPWAFMMLLLIRKTLVACLRQNPFILYCSVIFIPGFVVYWFSPNIDTAARYFFMLLPLLYVVIVYLYHHPNTSNTQRNIIDYTIMSVFAIAAVGSLALPWVKETAGIPFVWPKSVFLLLGIGASVWMAYHQPPNRIAFLVLALVIIRFAFNWFVIDNRGGYQREQLAHFHTVLEKSRGKTLAIEKGAEVGNTDGLSYNYLLETGRILPISDSTITGVCYITSSASAAKYPHRILYRWPGHLADDLWLVERMPQQSDSK